MAKYTYQLQFLRDDTWVSLFGLQSSSLLYLRGFCEGSRSADGLRPAYRILRDDGKVVEEVREREKLPLGMVAGFPTPEQYERAAAKALAAAQALRLRKRNRETADDDRERVLLLTSPHVLDALAPEHRKPRYPSNTCSDLNVWDRRQVDSKEHACLRCQLLLAREAAEEAEQGLPTNHTLWIQELLEINQPG